MYPSSSGSRGRPEGVPLSSLLLGGTEAHAVPLCVVGRESPSPPSRQAPTPADSWTGGGVMGRPWQILCLGVSLVPSFAVWTSRALAAQPEAGRVSAAAPLGQTGWGAASRAVH